MKRIYERYEALSPIYKGGLTNHLPMVLTALKKLEVPREITIDILENYKEDKGLLDLTEQTTPVSEYEQVYINRTSFYLGDIHHRGEDVVIGEFLNKYKMNLGCALFHGIIRLSYAKQEGDDLMIAQALSYYELSSEKVDFMSTYITEKEFMSNLTQMKESMKQSGMKIINGRTSESFNEFLKHDFVVKNLRKLRVPSKDFIINLLLTEYENTRSFYTLHLITGFDALLELEEYIYDFSDILNQFLLYAQVFLLFDVAKSEHINIERHSFQEMMKNVHLLKGAHEIKFFYSLLRLNKLFDNERLLRVANSIFAE